MNLWRHTYVYTYLLFPKDEKCFPFNMYNAAGGKDLPMDEDAWSRWYCT